MTDWISCKEVLPSVGKVVEVKKDYDIERVKRSAGDLNCWKYPSGLHWKWIDASDRWRPINE